MPRKPFDPLTCIPSPEVVREKLAETLCLAERLRILLDLTERLRLPLTTAEHIPTPASRTEVAGE
ncbi:MAG TPA: hypothetical protein VFT74_21860 [Isosphaeraceae bacterium]|nr:hypothetical protein [Isosphaeraceae bacterium]